MDIVIQHLGKAFVQIAKGIVNAHILYIAILLDLALNAMKILNASHLSIAILRTGSVELAHIITNVIHFIVQMELVVIALLVLNAQLAFALFKVAKTKGCVKHAVQTPTVLSLYHIAMKIKYVPHA